MRSENGAGVTFDRVSHTGLADGVMGLLGGGLVGGDWNHGAADFLTVERPYFGGLLDAHLTSFLLDLNRIGQINRTGFVIGYRNELLSVFYGVSRQRSCSFSSIATSTFFAALHFL